MRSGRKFRMGDKVRIKVVAANLDKRQLDYEWVLNACNGSMQKNQSKRKKEKIKKEKEESALKSNSLCTSFEELSEQFIRNISYTIIFLSNQQSLIRAKSIFFELRWQKSEACAVLNG